MAIDQETKKDWLTNFRGATLKLHPTFGNPKVCHMFDRNFNNLGRNGFFMSVRGRVVLGEAVADEAEKLIYSRMEEQTKSVENKIKWCHKILADEAIVDLASYENAQEYVATVVSPVQKRYIELLRKCDELFVLLSTLMLHGAISESEHSKNELQIKKHMRAVPSAMRKLTIALGVKMRAQSEADRAKLAATTAAAPDAANDAKAEKADTAAATGAPETPAETPADVAIAA
ncbi:hypothetical protein [Azonexus hydrophilus]|uniref:DUF1845 domain-containing protein n=1 Tax=Azonexus hydrophilus TaxID=418702 RepID=A0ABZ2XLN6_9RHOO